MTSSWPCLQDWVKEVQGGVKEVSTEVNKGGTKEVQDDIRDSKNQLSEQGPATGVLCPDLTHIVGLVGEEAAVPVSSCHRRFFNSQECGEERLGDYMDYWRNRQVDLGLVNCWQVRKGWCKVCKGFLVIQGPWSKVIKSYQLLNWSKVCQRYF